MREIAISDYLPESIITIYKNKESDFYLENAKLSFKKGKLIPGAFSPLRKQDLMDLTKASMTDFMSINYNAFKQERKILSLKIKGDKIEVVWIFEPCVRNLYFSETMKSIKSGLYPIPRLIFKVKDSQMSIYALKDDLSLNATLYMAPYGNIYENGGVCTGNVKIKKNETDISKIIKNWEDTFFNSYFTHMIDSHVIKGNIVSLYNKIIDTALFPYDVLVPTKKKISTLL
jgi:PRTRC genetic system protein B